LTLLSIVIPAYNEEKRLSPTLDRIFAYLDENPGRSTEVLVVDDGSKDGTANLVKERQKTERRLKLVENPGNRGKGYSVRHGMCAAQGDWRLMTDADLSAPIEDLDKLIEAATKNGAKVAIGSRALDRTLIGVHQSRWRELSGVFFNFVMRTITGLKFKDTQCGFKLFHRDAAALIFPRQQIDGFGFDAEDLFIARKLEIPSIEVPVRWNNVEGTKVSLVLGMKPFADLLLIRWYSLTGRYRR
jgi:glycosyltransferase involved in cell wall biosynthesis